MTNASGMRTTLRRVAWLGILWHLAMVVRCAAAQAPDPTHYWIEQTLDKVVKYQQNPLRAARSLAYISVAMDRAAQDAGSEDLRPEPAQHAAAGAMLDYLYPQENPARYRAMARFLASQLCERACANAGVTIGLRTAEELAARAREDGADRTWDPRLRPADRPGVWRAAPPLNVYAPSEPLAGTWRTWLVGRVEGISTPEPVAYDSPRYWRETREVWDVARTLTAGQRKIADEWNLDKGSVTPVGVWNRKMLQALKEAGHGSARSARVAAAANAAMYDALVACWHVKYRYWTLRPVNAIRERYDADFLPYLYTPPFPSYVSGHSAVSGAAAEVLGALFPERAERFAAMAREAADSRLYGGIHFRSDNEEGLQLGRRVGRIALDAFACCEGRVNWLAP
jgi:PAP2 superfamily